MDNTTSIIFKLIILTLCCLFIQTAAAAQNRIALVIGNSNYELSPLKNPANDARDISIELKRFGFKVDKLINADIRSMKKAIRNFGKKLSDKNTVGLFFYAGHGVQVKNTNYLVPIGANIESEAEVEFETINAGRILAQMSAADNGLNLMILDACRNNPFTRSFRSASRGLAKMYAPNGSVILYATSPGSVAADGTGKNGLFTEKLIKAMKQPGLKIEDVFKKTAIEVSRESSKAQVPYFEGVILGDFYINTLEKKKVKQKQQTQITTPAKNDIKDRQELAFWDSVDKSPSIESYKAYTSQYPNGIYKQLALIKIKQLSDQQKLAKLKKNTSKATQDSVQRIQKVEKVLPKDAKVTIRSNVIKDTVSINGEKKGSTKLIVKLTSGVYELKITKNGYQTWFQSIKVIAGQDQLIYAKLKLIPKPPAPIKHKVSNKNKKTIISKTIIKDNPLKLSDCITNQKVLVKQITNCNKLIKKNPRNYKLYTTLGRLFNKQENYQASVDLYKQALDNFPNNSLLMKKLSIAESNLKEQSWITNKQKTSKEANKNSSVEYKLNKIRCFRLKGNKALNACKQALKINPNNIKIKAKIKRISTSRN